MYFFGRENENHTYLDSLLKPGKVRHILNLCGEHGRNGLHASERHQDEVNICYDGEDGQPGQDAFNGTMIISGNIENLQIQFGEDISQFPLSSNEIVLIRCIGGDGGNGGDGQCNMRKGLIGGRAGNGGDGGHAGDVIICTESPFLLALIEIENRGGKGGFPGVPSRHSRSEQNGQAGHYGEPGLNGSLTFHIVSSSESALLETGASKFAANIMTMNFHDASKEGVFEPGSDLIIDEIDIMNDGDLSIPKGARLVIQTAYCLHPVFIQLPKLNPREHYIRRQIHIPLPTNYIGSLNILATVTLANRPIGPRSQLCLPIILRHPIRLKDVQVPQALGPLEQTAIKITLENVTFASYGRDHGHRIDVELQLNQFLRHTSSTNTSPSVNSISMQHKLSPVAIVTQVFNIESHSCKSFELGITATSDEDSQHLYSCLPIQVQLFLNGHLAETVLKQIRYIPNPLTPPPMHADILLLTTLAFSRLNYSFWKAASSKLGLSILSYNVDLDFPEHFTASDYLRKCRFIVAVSSNMGDLFRFPSHFISQHLQNNPSARLLVAGLYDQTSLIAFLVGLNYSSPIDCKQFRTWNFSFLEERLINKVIQEKQASDNDFRYYAVYRVTDKESPSVISCCGLRRQLPSLFIYRSVFPVSFKLHTLPVQELSAIEQHERNTSLNGHNYAETEVRFRNLEVPLAKSILSLMQFMTLEEKITLLLNSGDDLMIPYEQSSRVSNQFNGIAVADLASISLAYNLWKDFASDDASETDIIETSLSLSLRLTNLLKNYLSENDTEMLARAAYIFELPLRKIKWASCLPNHRFDIRQSCLQKAQHDILICHASFSIKSQLKTLYRKWNRMVPILFNESSSYSIHLQRVKRIVIQNNFIDVLKADKDSMFFADQKNTGEIYFPSDTMALCKVPRGSEKIAVKSEARDGKEESSSVLLQLLKKGEI